LRDELFHDAVTLHELDLGLLPIGRDDLDALVRILGQYHYARRQVVVPSGLSSRMTPAAVSSARIASASAKLRGFLAAGRRAMASSIAASPPASAPPTAAWRNSCGVRPSRPSTAANCFS